MTAKYIIGSIAGSFVIAYVCDHLVSERKIFGGKLHIPKLVYNFILVEHIIHP